jgi:hypothetical protein
VIQRIGSVPRQSNPPGLGSFARKPPPSFKFTTRSFHCIGFLANRSCFLRLLTVNSCIKVRLDLQADKSPVVVKGPFFP